MSVGYTRTSWPGVAVWSADCNGVVDSTLDVGGE